MRHLVISNGITIACHSSQSHTETYTRSSGNFLADLVGKLLFWRILCSVAVIKENFVQSSLLFWRILCHLPSRLLFLRKVFRVAGEFFAHISIFSEQSR